MAMVIHVLMDCLLTQEDNDACSINNISDASEDDQKFPLLVFCAAAQVEDANKQMSSIAALVGVAT